MSVTPEVPPIDLGLPRRNPGLDLLHSSQRTEWIGLTGSSCKEVAEVASTKSESQMAHFCEIPGDLYSALRLQLDDVSMLM